MPVVSLITEGAAKHLNEAGETCIHTDFSTATCIDADQSTTRQMISKERKEGSKERKPGDAVDGAGGHEGRRS